MTPDNIITLLGYGITVLGGIGGVIWFLVKWMISKQDKSISLLFAYKDKQDDEIEKIKMAIMAMSKADQNQTMIFRSFLGEK